MVLFKYMKREPEHSALQYVLLALVPYSRSNMQLVFKPNYFFNELEKISNLERKKLQRAYYYAIGHGYAELEDDATLLTQKGRAKIAPYLAKKLGKDAYLMVVFDIPEAERSKRRILRNYLKHRGFTQVQRSVWISKMDYKSELKQLVDDLMINDCVEIFESARV